MYQDGQFTLGADTSAAANSLAFLNWAFITTNETRDPSFDLHTRALLMPDIPRGAGDAFALNLENRVFSYLNDQTHWSDADFAASGDGPSPEVGGGEGFFYDVVGYSPGEMRAITLFYLQNYHYAATVQPLEGFAGIDAQKPMHASTYLGDEIADFGTFMAYFPQNLFSDTISAAEDMARALLPDAEANYIDDLHVANPPAAARSMAEVASWLQRPALRPLVTLGLLSFKASGARLLPRPYYQYASAAWPNQCVTGRTPLLEPCPARLTAGYAGYREFVAGQLAARLCPLLARGDGFFDFSPSFLGFMQQALGILEPAQFCALARQPRYLRIGMLHDRYVQRVLTDIVRMGKKASLKPGLASLLGRVAFYKEKERSSGAPLAPAAFRRLLGFYGVIHHDAALFSVENRAIGELNLWNDRPTLISQYVSLYARTHRTVGTDDASGEYLIHPLRPGADGSVNQEDLLVLGRSARLVAALVQSYEESKSHSLFYFLIKAIEKLGSPSDTAPLEGLVHLVAHSDGVETNKAIRMFSFFLKWYAEQNGGTIFSWDKPGHHLIKQLVRAEGMRDGHALFESVSPGEISSFIRLAELALGSMGPTPRKAEIIEKVAQYLLDEMTVVVPQDGVLAAGADSLQRNLDQFDAVSLSIDSKRALHSLLSRLDAPWQTLEGATIPPLVRKEAVTALATFLVDRGPQILLTYQAADLKEPDFFREMVMGFLPSGAALGAASLAQIKSLITDKRAGLVEGHLLWEAQIRDPASRRRLVEVVGVLGRAAKNQWLGALSEFSQVFSTMHRFMAFLQAKIEWKDQDLAPDYSASLGMLVRLSSAENHILTRQASLLERWFESKKNVKASSADFSLSAF